MSMPLKGRQKIEDAPATGIDEMGHHGPLSFLGDQAAQIDAAQVLAGRGGLQPALFGDFQQGKAGAGLDQLQDSDPMLVGEGFRDDGQPRQGIGLMDQAHPGLNCGNRKRMRSKSDIFRPKARQLSMKSRMAENVDRWIKFGYPWKVELWGHSLGVKDWVIHEKRKVGGREVSAIHGKLKGEGWEVLAIHGKFKGRVRAGGPR